MAALAVAVVLRMAVHALFLPAFEGPDEPYHLARALAFASAPLARAFAGAPVEAPLAAAVRGKPCSENLHRVFGCALFGASPARFDVLAPDTAGAEPGRSLVNTEDNQMCPLRTRSDGKSEGFTVTHGVNGNNMSLACVNAGRQSRT